MWTAGGYFSLLPWSCVVLESVHENEVAALRSRLRGAAAAAAEIARAGGPTTPTPQQEAAERVRRVLPASILSSCSASPSMLA